MDLYLTDAHLELRDSVRAFAQDEIAPIAREHDEQSRFPWQTVRGMADRGWFGANVPEQYGGLGLDTLSYMLIIEELARVDVSHSITISAHNTLGVSPILNFGSDDQKRRFLPFLTRRVLGGFGLTEPGAGSDAGATRTTAVREGDSYRVTGSKIFITHAGVGEVFVATAVTDRSKGVKGITSFIVTKETTDREAAESVGFGHAPELEPFTPGVRSGKKEDKMGWRASDTRELILEDAVVPAADRLGEEGQGFINFMKTLDAGRIGIGALSLGLAQGAFDTCVEYAGGRQLDGAPMKDAQGVQFTLADMATEISAARHLVYHAAWLKENGRSFTVEASKAKLYASELAMRTTTRAVQFLGAAGYTSEYPVERMMRDAKICEIGEGTSEVQRLVIGRSLFRTAAASA
ncbi:MAG TPA: acyl-CoA dehydrogenase family protein [Longimicrobiales bacterium]|nr:acyl-CoA dehydrogenase family protein [Longimicrobiales bacterium]